MKMTEYLGSISYNGRIIPSRCILLWWVHAWGTCSNSNQPL